MLFKNGEIVDLKNGKDEDAIHYRDMLKEVDETVGFPLVFKRTESYMSYSDFSMDKNGAITKRVPESPMIIIPNFTSTSNEYRTDEWRWSKNIPRKKDGEYIFPRDARSSKFDKPVFKVDKTDFDFAYFLLYKNPNFSKYYTLEDNRADAKQSVESKIKEAKIYNAFYGERSKLLTDAKLLREVARSYHIAHVDKMSKEQILTDLESLVREEDRNGVRSVDDFLESLHGGEDVELGAMVQKAEDLKIIKFDDRTSFWFLCDGDGNLKDTICEVPKKEKEFRYEILKDELSITDELKTKIESLIGAYDSIKEKDIKLNFDNLENEDYTKVQEYLKLHNISDTGRGRPKALVFKDVRAHAGVE